MEILVKQVIESWNQQIRTSNKLIEMLNDEELQQEIAPGKNTGTYLLGHLVAVHDALLPLLGLGDKLYPELEEPFIRNPDKSGFTYPSIDALRESWKQVNQVLDNHLASQPLHSWQERHTAVSPEAFEKEPHRNKLNVLLSRTSHLAYHAGQLALLKK